MGRQLLYLKRRLTSISPPIIVFLSFLLVILLGATLLTLPIAHEPGVRVTFLDALYTSTSATCVTGLVVFDTAETFSTFGEIVILMLIQIGGLGLITIMTFFISMMGRKAGLRGMVLAQESLNTFDWNTSVRLIRRVVLVVLGIELVGAVLLSIAFVPEFGLKGIYYAIFHSVSAFSNAGFDLFGGLRSVSDFYDHPLVLYTINGLIMIGGVGFIVWQDLWDYRKTKKLRLHTKFVLVISSILWIGGAAFIFFVERANVNTLGQLPMREAVDGAFFLSVNARTAGFATLNLYGLNDVTKVFVSILMFIGAASGSTAGGIKVNTLGVLLIAVFSVIRSSEEVVCRNRIIPISTVLKAFTIFFLSGIWLVIITLAISLLNPEFRLVNALFESTSAFGTVGLSIGMSTAQTYDSISKILHILTMFVGRVGPMTFAITLALGAKKAVDRIYPEGKIVVG